MKWCPLVCGSARRWAGSPTFRGRSHPQVSVLAPGVLPLASHCGVYCREEHRGPSSWTASVPSAFLPSISLEAPSCSLPAPWAQVTGLPTHGCQEGWRTGARTCLTPGPPPCPSLCFSPPWLQPAGNSMLSLRFSQINVCVLNPKLVLLPPFSLKCFLIVLGSFYFIAGLLKFCDCIYDKFIICLQTGFPNVFS